MNKTFEISKEVLILTMYETYKGNDKFLKWVSTNKDYYLKNFPNRIISLDKINLDKLDKKQQIVLELIGCSFVDAKIQENMAEFLKSNYPTAYLLFINTKIIDTQKAIEFLNKKLNFNLSYVYGNLCALLFFAYINRTQVINSAALEGYIGFYINHQTIVANDRDTEESPPTEDELHIVETLKNSIYKITGDLTDIVTYIKNPKSSTILQHKINYSFDGTLGIEKLIHNNVPTNDYIEKLLLNYIRTELSINGLEDENGIENKTISVAAASQYLVDAIHIHAIEQVLLNRED